MKIILKAKKPPNHPNPPLKEKEKGVKIDSKLGGQWNVPSLVTNGGFQAWWPMEGFQAWWPMEGSKLGGQWKVPSLLANGRFQACWPMEGEGETPFHLFHFPPNNFTQTFNFSL